jgi:hypothetical protein
MYIGTIYQYIFCLANQILMLNLVIAILGTVYANLNALSNGLLYDELIEVMPEMDWHDQFGSIVCVQRPLQWFYIIILPVL